MATATLSSVPATVSTAESTTGWSGPKTYALEPDIKVQGSNSVATLVASSGTTDWYYSGFTAADLSSVHLRLWFNAAFVGNLSSTNPIQPFISDGTNTAYWSWTEGVNYSGGWAQVVIDTSATVLSGTKPTGNSTRVGIRFNCASKPRNVPANVWFDAWYYGDGYTVYGGTSGDAIDWSHVAATDATSAYGIITDISGVYIAKGAVQIGDGTNTTYFEPSTQILQFADEQVNSTLYEVAFVDSASNLTNVEIAGGAWSAEGTQRYVVDADDTNLNSFDITGLQISKADLITFASGQSITNAVFNNCLQIDPSTATFNTNVISNYTGTEGGALLWPSSINTHTINFINCDYGVEITQTVDQSFIGMSFDDAAGNYDVGLSGGTSITVSLDSASNANSYYDHTTSGDTVTFSSSVTLTIDVTDEAGDPISSAYAYIDNNNLTPFIMNTTTNASGIASVSHTGGAVTGSTWRVRKYGYHPYKGTIDIGSSDISLPVTLITHPQQI